jgi:hypothetical protein
MKRNPFIPPAYLECRNDETWVQHLERGGLCFAKSTFKDQRTKQTAAGTPVMTPAPNDVSHRPAKKLKTSQTSVMSWLSKQPVRQEDEDDQEEPDDDVIEVARTLQRSRHRLESLRSRTSTDSAPAAPSETSEPGPSTGAPLTNKQKSQKNVTRQYDDYMQLLDDAIKIIEGRGKKTPLTAREVRQIDELKALLAEFRRNVKNHVREPLVTASVTIAERRAEETITQPRQTMPSRFGADDDTVERPYRHRSRVLRLMADHAIRFWQLPNRQALSRRGRKSILVSCSEIRLWLERHLSELPSGRIDPGRISEQLAEYLKSDEARLANLPNTVHQSTVIRWLRKIGFERKLVSKGLYHDGHERKDVVVYRQKIYLPQMAHFRKNAATWDNKPDGVWRETLPELADGEKEVVVIFHDETAVHAQEMPRHVWVYQFETVLRQKSDGKLMMISDFILEKGDGRLCLPKEQWGDRSEAECDARRVIEPGKNQDYWNLNQLCDQVAIALKIFNEAYPGKIALFVFDNSSAHGGYATDALRAEKMNLGTAGKVPSMHDTWYLDSNGVKRVQKMVFGEVNDPTMAFEENKKDETDAEKHKRLKGKPKGIRVVLKERKLWAVYEQLAQRNKKKLKLECDKCSGKAAKAERRAARQELLGKSIALAYNLEDEGEEADDDGPDTENITTAATSAIFPSIAGDLSEEDARAAHGCCWRNIMMHQPDFLEERPRIVNLIEAAGHQVMFLPKFHCELNPIELVWSMIKTQFRKEGGRSTIAGAREALKRAMAAPTPDQIRACFRHCWRYQHAYEKGMNPQQAVSAMKKYKSHRRIPENWAVSVSNLVNPPTEEGFTGTIDEASL